MKSFLNINIRGLSLKTNYFVYKGFKNTVYKVYCSSKETLLYLNKKLLLLFEVSSQDVNLSKSNDSENGDLDNSRPMDLSLKIIKVSVVDLGSSSLETEIGLDFIHSLVGRVEFLDGFLNIFDCDTGSVDYFLTSLDFETNKSGVFTVVLETGLVFTFFISNDFPVSFFHVVLFVDNVGLFSGFIDSETDSGIIVTRGHKATSKLSVGLDIVQDTEISVGLDLDSETTGLGDKKDCEQSEKASKFSIEHF